MHKTVVALSCSLEAQFKRQSVSTAAVGAAEAAAAAEVGAATDVVVSRARRRGRALSSNSDLMASLIKYMQDSSSVPELLLCTRYNIPNLRQIMIFAIYQVVLHVLL